MIRKLNSPPAVSDAHDEFDRKPDQQYFAPMARENSKGLIREGRFAIFCLTLGAVLGSLSTASAFLWLNIL